MRYVSKNFIVENKKQIIKIIVLIILIIIALFMYIHKHNEDRDLSISKGSGIKQEEQDKVNCEKEETGSDEKETSENIVVCDVSGEVVSPKVCELRKGSRIDDAINICGGLTDRADVSFVNRAQVIKDGEKIIIPKKGDKSVKERVIDNSKGRDKNTDDSTVSNSGNAGKLGGKVNINTASSPELQKITGIGPALAGRILEYRKSKGGFNKVEDLKKVKGIGNKKFDKIKDQVCI